MSSCDELRGSLMSSEEVKEKIDFLSSSIFEQTQFLKEYREEYREFLDSNQYLEAEDILEEICSTQEKISDMKEERANLLGH